MIECGICKRCKILPGPALQEDPFLCASCINFRTLKYRLNIIHLININETAVRHIDLILCQCLKHAVDVLLQYVESDERKRGMSLFKDTNISTDSVAMLAFMLAQVEIRSSILNIEQIQNICREKSIRNEQDKKKIEALKRLKLEKMDNVRRIKGEIDAVQSMADANKLTVAREMDIGVIKRQRMLIDKTRRSMVFDLLTLWDVGITHNENGSSLNILFIPILNVEKLVVQSLNFIIQTLLQVSEFVNAISKILDIHLPFAMGTEKNEVRIGDRVLKFNVDTTQSMGELSEMGAKALCRGVARLILNVTIVLRCVDEKYKTELTSMREMMALDAMLVRLVRALKERIGFDALMREKIAGLLAESGVQEETRRRRWWCRGRASVSSPAATAATAPDPPALPVRRHASWSLPHLPSTPSQPLPPTSSTSSTSSSLLAEEQVTACVWALSRRHG